MKKLLSIALAVVMMCTLAFSAAAIDDHSILPKNASDFEAANTANGTISVSKDGDSFVFEANTEWPSAYYVAEDNWLYFNTADDLYLYYDFEVVSGATNVLVYFAGQNPKEMAAMGTFLCINGLIDPSYVGPTGDAVVDLPVGKYSGKVAINDMGYGPEFMDDEGNMLVSGCKIFAVGENSKVVVNELCIGGPRGGEEEDKKDEESTTTTKKDDTKATTTTKKNNSKDDAEDSAKTGETSNAVLFVVIAVAAAGVVTLTATKKAKN